MLRRALLSFAAAATLAPGQTFEVLRVEANPEKGFHWAYFLGIPSRRVTPVHLLVEGNNTGSPTDDRAYTEQNAQSRVQFLMQSPLAQLGSPALVPAFLRPASNVMMYTHALDRDTLLATAPNLRRLDLQLVAMVEDAKARLSARGVAVEKRFFIWGYSASGTFAIRFALLQPEWVQAVSFGGCSAPPVPAAEYRGQALRYPNGTADYAELTGRQFDAAAFRSIPMYAYRGDQDSNDEVMYSDGYDEPDRNLIYQLFGPAPFPYLRYPKFESLYQLAGVKTRFLIQPAVGHSYGDMITETVEFFDKNRGAATPWLRPKPLFQRLYLPMLLSGSGWETEVTLYSNSEVPLSGEIRTVPEEGGTAIQTTAFTLSPFSSQTFSGAKLLADPSKPGYLAVAADSGFLSARSRLLKDGFEVFSPAGGALTHGVVPVFDSSANSAFVVLNPGTRAANVTMTSVDAAGGEVATTRFTLNPGARRSGTAEKLFGKVVPAAAAWFKYSADVPVVVSVFHVPAGLNVVDAFSGTDVYLR